MTREEAILVLDHVRPQTSEVDRQFYDDEDLNNALNMAVEALKMIDDFERAQLITGGRLDGRTYAYKCGLEDGKRKALEQTPCDDAVSRQAIRLKIADMPKYVYGKRLASIRHLKDFIKKELGDNIIVTEDVCVGFEICLEYIREFVRSLPSVTPATRWIPVSEKLPKEGITAEMFRNGSLESIEALMTEGEIYDLDYSDWTLASERLPEQAGEYLVTYHPCYWGQVREDIKVGLDSFRGKTTWAKNKYQKVIAWQPLPEPYKESEVER